MPTEAKGNTTMTPLALLLAAPLLSVLSYNGGMKIGNYILGDKRD
jgi:hypothetical protein